jgi:mannose-6-phosphate isomerase-like protein (cupin superfamily)
MKRLGCMALLMACGFLAAQAPAVNETGKGDLMASRVFTQAAGSVRTMANGGQSRDILYGTLATGEAINIHESTQPAGAKPNPLHTIEHSEFILVREGTLAFMHDGKEEKAGPGDLIYVSYGTLHTVRNVGDVPAKYVVIAMGGDAKK